MGKGIVLEKTGKKKRVLFVNLRFILPLSSENLLVSEKATSEFDMKLLFEIIVFVVLVE